MAGSLFKKDKIHKRVWIDELFSSIPKLLLESIKRLNRNRVIEIKNFEYYYHKLHGNATQLLFSFSIFIRKQWICKKFDFRF